MFEWVRDISSFKINHQRYQLCHYPILEYNEMFRNQRLLYGHTHNKRLEYFRRVMSPNAVNVSACRADYQPIGISRIERIIAWQWRGKFLKLIEFAQSIEPNENWETYINFDKNKNDLSVEYCKQSITLLATEIAKKIQNPLFKQMIWDMVP